ncbi:diphthamide biosynthesis protein 2 [Mytilinidion resinicola]|uniref:2-(3-amino-3-carboxypropyl)histidine synthase subunit 2 n=1 Tax=Mytilinidion resinicola TaxID=574789 RepID=A0A6A6Y0Y4_9PEZI|nr:diphthamide biosynthesis protein 2 [Mytilinidion resinicola]KAF2802218.1 diphthamide biosynthesis protein 2 [Mytilinidion resinicola]
MAASPLAGAPVLSTPDTHIFEDPTPPIDVSTLPRLSDEQLALTYEIARTVAEIRTRRWKRIALQFPDHMLVDAPRVFEALRQGLKHSRLQRRKATSNTEEPSINGHSVDDAAQDKVAEKLFILADTSYGACCVDEVAAEHVDADVVVHYGRSCLSPTARLPVIYVFTTRPLSLDAVLETFRQTYLEREQKIILMADIPYSSHIPGLAEKLRGEGYTGIFTTSIVHNPSSPLPNRAVPADVVESKDALREYQLFHISEPPPSLLLTLSSRVGAIHIFPTDGASGEIPKALLASSAMTLRRRYALLTSLSTVSVFGILINTLSVKNYMHMLDHVKQEIAAAGKKSYTFVVGKVNAAKVANFSEVGGWVVIGCWESSLMESKDFWKPVITPFELSLALKGDTERIWTGEWSSDFQALLEQKAAQPEAPSDGEQKVGSDDVEAEDFDSEEESAPPEFDLRMGHYVSHSRPMRASNATNQKQTGQGEAASAKQSLVKRANGDLAKIGGVVSPGAEYLRSQRTWQGLGSDFEAPGEGESADTAGAPVEIGRSGIARGYVVGDDRSER